MNGYSPPSGDKPYDLVTGHRGTAFGKPDGEIRNALYHNAALGLHGNGSVGVCVSGFHNVLQYLFVGQYLFVISVVEFLNLVHDLPLFQGAVADCRQYRIPIPETVFPQDGFHVFLLKYFG